MVVEYLPCWMEQLYYRVTISSLIYGDTVLLWNEAGIKLGEFAETYPNLPLPLQYIPVPKPFKLLVFGGIS
jgi:hypothetical protein